MSGRLWAKYTIVLAWARVLTHGRGGTHAARFGSNGCVGRAAGGRRRRSFCFAENNVPYKTLKDLPDSVRNVLPRHAQEIYMEAFNNAYEEYAYRGDEREETAHKVAWTAVKKKYEKDKKTGEWEPKE